MDELKQLLAKMEDAFTGRLVSVVLYGSGAAGEHDKRFSDLNVLCVLNRITPQELQDGEPVVRWWREHGHPSPLMMTEDEVAQSADSFPIEFRDMKERRRVLFGLDVIAELHVDMRNHRVQLEHDLRTALLRLRQQAAGLLSDPVALMNLCLDSVSTFCVLGRHALFAAGAVPAQDRRAILHQLAKAIPADMTPMLTLLDIREDRAGVDPGDPGELFAQYLVCVQELVRYVDRLDGEHETGKHETRGHK